MSALSAHSTTPFSGQGIRVGVFDSGVGGLSVLKAIRQAMPLADLIYVADSGFAPYGERSDAFISERSNEISSFLQSQEVHGIVVACNTATAVAVHELRQLWPHLPIIGVEPGIKPAISQSRNKKIGVLATPGTLASQKFKSLVTRHEADAELHLQACPGLARTIESGNLNRQELKTLIAQFCAPLKDAGVDTVVLGCTHYPFVANQLQASLGKDVYLLDTAQAVAKHTAAILQNTVITSSTDVTRGEATFWTTGDPALLQQVAESWLGWQVIANKLPSKYT